MKRISKHYIGLLTRMSDKEWNELYISFNSWSKFVMWDVGDWAFLWSSVFYSTLSSFCSFVCNFDVKLTLTWCKSRVIMMKSVCLYRWRDQIQFLCVLDCLLMSAGDKGWNSTSHHHTLDKIIWLLKLKFGSYALR